MKTFENPYAIPLWEIKWKREIILILCRNPFIKGIQKPRFYSLDDILEKHLVGISPVTFPVEICVVKYFLASMRNQIRLPMITFRQIKGVCILQFDREEFIEQIYKWFENHVKEEYGVYVKA